MITATWTPSNTRKTTTVCFENGTATTLDHQYATVTVSDPHGRTSDVHRLGRSSLGDRYAAMCASYAAKDSLLFSTAVENSLHGHLHAVT
jgi:phage baseplate assembly protein gpV